jgi:hypothetical protein
MMSVTTVTHTKVFRWMAPAEVAAAIIAAEGNVTVAAERLGCARETIHRHAKRSALVASALVEARDRGIDTAESMLMNAIHNGEAWAICFFLKTQAKHRGYVERQELVHRGDAEAPIAIITLIPPAPGLTEGDADA